MDTIYEIVRRVEQDDISGNTTISKYVSFNMRDNIDKIDAYLNSKHISGDVDSMGREKPFFNIVTAAVNVWYRATDIDRKNIRISSKKAKSLVVSFLATAKIQEWMKKARFGVFLNEWGRSLARYGSSVVKFVEKEGELFAEVIPWNRIMVDPIDFGANVKIEVLELTPAQLRKREGYDQKQVENLIDTATTRKTIEGQTTDTKAGYIKLYEIHGELSLSLLTDKEKDEDTYVQQMHVISFVKGKGTNEFDDFTLASGREEKDPYMITHLIKEDGRTQSIGAVEHLFEAQWMMNHTVKGIKDQLDIASKLFFQTSDGNFVGQNAIDALETGDILIHQANMPLTQVNNSSHDITSLQNFGQMWKNLSQEIVSTPDSLMGNTAPSGTAWRQVEALQQEAHSLFQLMVENKGLDIEEMMRVRVIPFIKKQLDTSEEVVATLDSYGIESLDSMYIRSESIKRNNDKNIEAILNDTDITTVKLEAQGVRTELSDMGAQRFYKPSEIESVTWTELFDDFEWDCEVDVTGESTQTQEDITTLTTMFQTIADPNKAQVLQTPEGKFLFNQIVERAGAVSPIQLSTQQTPTPVGGGAATGGALPVNQ